MPATTPGVKLSPWRLDYNCRFISHAHLAAVSPPQAAAIHATAVVSGPDSLMVVRRMSRR